jgi:glycosyltransferase involved in cell wall biosynthesis
MVTSMFSFLGNLDPFDGYGYSTIKIAQAFKRIAFAGSVAQVVSLADEEGIPTRPLVQGTAVCLASPVWWPMVKGADLFVGYTMFEATRLPKEYIKVIPHMAHRVIVPTAWGKSVFEESGVTVPVEVVPLGIDPADYYPLERKRADGRPYTFAWSGTPDMRKGWDVAYRAFRRAFGDRDDVRLRLHFRRLPKDGISFRDNNVEVLHGSFPLPEMREFYRRADCFVFPSRGEGWGMPPREAAATGLPVITTDWSGLRQDIASWAYPLDVKELVPAEYGHWDAGQVGLWAQPDEDHLIALMRSCVDRRDEAAAFGQGASRWLLANNTWERTARGIMTIVALAENQEAVC